MTVQRLSVLTSAALLCATCSSEPAPPPRTAGPMGHDVVARVAGVEIPAASVARVAVTQAIPPARAREIVVSDALLAAGARDRGLDTSPQVRAALNAEVARRLLQGLLDDAERAGPVTDEELRVATERHWLELDRPEGFRTVHAVVRLHDGADGSVRDRARALAESIRAAVAPARDLAIKALPPQPVPGQPPSTDPAADAFQKAARAVPADGLEVVAEALPPITAAGRVLTPGDQRFDADFARAASTLTARGDLSPPVVSAFGVHIVMLLERIPSQIVAEEERRRLVREEVVTGRARTAQKQLLDTLRRDAGIADGVDALLQMVRIEP